MKAIDQEIEPYRVTTGVFKTTNGYPRGMFKIPFRNVVLCVICCDEFGGWEHVSVSLKNRNPNWDEMSFIKSKFWDEEEAVLQFHPPRSQYVNNHAHCLHLWKPVGEQLKLPNPLMVGVPDKWLTQQA